jgi:hypothetical protein
MTLDGKMNKIKVVNLNEIYNFVVDNYFIKIIYSLKFISEVSKF